METTDKKSVQQLVNILWQQGLKHIVISPGSRNAPLILGFTSHSKYQTLSVPDERSAGFIALGLAQQTQSPVALVCSSGSALLNYYPAIAEAFYRNIPLIVLSADRPERLIDQGDGQTIRQKAVYANHILYSSHLDELPTTSEEINENLNRILTATQLAIPSNINPGGPVHLNLPFEEPLYNMAPFKEELLAQSVLTRKEKPQNYNVEEIAHLWNKAEKVMLLVGQQEVDTDLMQQLQKINPAALILSEVTSNLPLSRSITSIDRLISGLNETENKDLQPDLLITLGGNIVSKRIKGFLRQHQPKNHVHIGVSMAAPNTYQCLTHSVNIDAYSFFKDLIPQLKLAPNSWVNRWLDLDTKKEQLHTKFLTQVAFSDLQVMHTLNKIMPTESVVHLANSTPVRYAQLFSWDASLVFHANRGTSGIDGIVSTAMGTAIATHQTVVLIVGDISFFYDTNAWWHAQIPNNLKVVVINNNGGGIFRFIEGPKSTGQLEKHFETHQKNSVEHIALGFGVDYFCASNLTDLKKEFSNLISLPKSGILEVFTPQNENADILKSYFKNLNNN